MAFFRNGTFPCAFGGREVEGRKDSELGNFYISFRCFVVEIEKKLFLRQHFQIIIWEKRKNTGSRSAIAEVPPGRRILRGKNARGALSRASNTPRPYGTAHLTSRTCSLSALRTQPTDPL